MIRHEQYQPLTHRTVARLRDRNDVLYVGAATLYAGLS